MNPVAGITMKGQREHINLDEILAALARRERELEDLRATHSRVKDDASSLADERDRIQARSVELRRQRDAALDETRTLADRLDWIRREHASLRGRLVHQELASDQSSTASSSDVADSDTVNAERNAMVEPLTKHQVAPAAKQAAHREAALQSATNTADRADVDRLNGTLAAMTAERDALARRVNALEAELTDVQAALRAAVEATSAEPDNAIACVRELESVEAESEAATLRHDLALLESELAESRSAAHAAHEQLTEDAERIAALERTIETNRGELLELSNMIERGNTLVRMLPNATNRRERADRDWGVVLAIGLTLLAAAALAYVFLQ